MLHITEVKIELAGSLGDMGGCLRAFASITLNDALALRDLRVVEGDRGLFVAMPSRKLADKCPECRVKNPLRAHYCNNCGVRLEDDRVLVGVDGTIPLSPDGRPRMHVDVTYPINPACRKLIHDAVLAAYQAELERAAQAACHSHPEGPARPPASDDAREPGSVGGPLRARVRACA